MNQWQPTQRFTPAEEAAKGRLADMISRLRTAKADWLTGSRDGESECLTEVNSLERAFSNGIGPDPTIRLAEYQGYVLEKRDGDPVSSSVTSGSYCRLACRLFAEYRSPDMRRYFFANKELIDGLLEDVSQNRADSDAERVAGEIHRWFIEGCPPSNEGISHEHKVEGIRLLGALDAAAGVTVLQDLVDSSNWFAEPRYALLALKELLAIESRRLSRWGKPQTEQVPDDFLDWACNTELAPYRDRFGGHRVWSPDELSKGLSPFTGGHTVLSSDVLLGVRYALEWSDEWEPAPESVGGEDEEDERSTVTARDVRECALKVLRENRPSDGADKHEDWRLIDQGVSPDDEAPLNTYAERLALDPRMQRSAFDDLVRIARDEGDPRQSAVIRLMEDNHAEEMHRFALEEFLNPRSPHQAWAASFVRHAAGLGEAMDQGERIAAILRWYGASQDGAVRALAVLEQAQPHVSATIELLRVAIDADDETWRTEALAVLCRDGTAISTFLVGEYLLRTDDDLLLGVANEHFLSGALSGAAAGPGSSQLVSTLKALATQVKKLPYCSLRALTRLGEIRSAESSGALLELFSTVPAHREASAEILLADTVTPQVWRTMWDAIPDGHSTGLASVLGEKLPLSLEIVRERGIPISELGRCFGHGTAGSNLEVSAIAVLAELASDPSAAANAREMLMSGYRRTRTEGAQLAIVNALLPHQAEPEVRRFLVAQLLALPGNAAIERTIGEALRLDGAWDDLRSHNNEWIPALAERGNVERIRLAAISNLLPLNLAGEGPQREQWMKEAAALLRLATAARAPGRSAALERLGSRIFDLERVQGVQALCAELPVQVARAAVERFAEEPAASPIAPLALHLRVALRRAHGDLRGSVVEVARAFDAPVASVRERAHVLRELYGVGR